MKDIRISMGSFFWKQFKQLLGGTTSSRSQRRNRHRRSPLNRPSALFEQLESRTLLSVNVLTFQDDNTRSGVNPNETILSPTNVTVGSFGKLYSTGLDGQVYAQPLIDTGVTITNGPNTTAGQSGLHDVAFVATENDSLYAIDASNAGGGVLWKRSFLDVSATGNTAGSDINNTIGASTIVAVPYDDLTPNPDITPVIGITGTPVIDATTNLLYLVVKTKEAVVANGTTTYHYVQRLHAVHLSDGTDAVTPYTIGDTTGNYTNYANNTPIYVYGSGAGSTADTYNNTSQLVVPFNAAIENQRGALNLVNGKLYVDWASHGDNGPYHGWIAAWDVSNLATNGFQLSGVFNSSPNTSEGGIWQGSGGLTFESDGSTFYFETGNGSGRTGSLTLNSAGFPSDGGYNEAVVKMVPDTTTSPSNQNTNGWGFKVADFFIPYNQVALDNSDRDLGSGAPLILPDNAGNIPNVPHLLVASGKEGKIYLINRDHMGGYDPVNDNVLNSIPNGSGNNTPPVQVGGSFSSPAYFNGTLYWSSGYSDWTYAYSINSNGTISVKSQTNATMGYIPGSATISANGTQNGIVWVMDRNLNLIRAYSASSLATELWDSGQKANGGDSVGAVTKFAVPTIANGLVFVGTQTGLVVYGLTPPSTAVSNAPVVSASAASDTSINLTWTDSSSSPNLAVSYAIEESTDGTNFNQITTAPGGSNALEIGGLNPSTTYSFRIYGVNPSGNSAESNIATATTSGNAGNVPPNAPSGLGASPLNATSINLSWTNNSTNQSGFYLDRATDPAFLNNLVTQTLPFGNNSFTDSASGLAPAGTYYYRLRAFNNAGSSGSSNVVSVSIPVAPPKPSNATVTNVTASEVDLSWTDNAGTSATAYVILRDVNHGTFVNYATLPPLHTSPPNTFTWVDTNVTPGTFYEYHIEAVNSSGNNDFSGTNTYTLSSPPSIPKFTAGATSLSLTWTAPAGAISYNVYRATSPGSEGTIPYAQNLTDTTFTDTSVSSGVTYYYTVTAVNGNSGISPNIPSESSPSIEVFGTLSNSAPPAPANISVNGSAGQNTLTWDSSNGAVGYNVYRGLAPGAEGAVAINSSLVTGTSFTDAGLVNGTRYYYVVIAVNGFGSSSPSAEAIGTPQSDGIVSGLVHRFTLNNTTNDSIGTDNGTLVNGPAYVTGKSGSALSFNGVNQSVSIPDTSDLEFSRTQSFTESVWVNLSSLPTYWTGIVTKSRDAYPWYGIWINPQDQWVFGGPNNIISTATATAGVWHLVTAVQDGAAGTRTLYVDGVIVASGTAQDASGSGNMVIGGASGVTEYLAGAVDDVRIYNVALSADQVAIAYGSSNLPRAVSLFPASVGSEQITLNWTAAAGATGYNIYRGTSSGGEIATPINSSPVTGTFFTDNTVSDGTNYYYVVSAVNSYGSSSASGEVSASSISPPTGLTATASNGKVALSWTPSNGETDGYDVYRGTLPGYENGLLITINPTSDPTFVDTKAVNGKTYYYFVVALNTNGSSDPSVEVSATPVSPVISVSNTSLNLGTTTTGTASTSIQSYTVGGTHLTNNVVISAPAGVELSKDSGATWQTSETLAPTNGTLASTTIQVRISASAKVGSITGNITNISSGATELDISVSGNVNALPSISVSNTSLSLGTTTTGTASNPGQTYTVSGTNLTNNVVITAPTGVELSKDGGATWQTSETLIPTNGTLAITTIQVRISASATIGSITGNITNISSGATELDISVSGNVNALPSISVSNTSLSLGTTTTGTASNPVQTYTVSGANLTNNFVITAPTGVELSKDGGATWQTSETLTPINGTLATTTIQVRISASATVGSITGNITNVSSGATEVDLNTSGIVTPAVATIIETTVSWGTVGTSGPLVTQADGLRLLPAGRKTDFSWLGINRITITLSTAESLSPLDVSVTGRTVANYGPVTLVGGGTSYTIILAQAINQGDRVTVTIGNVGITTFTRRLDVLPGDANDDGVVNSTDGVMTRNASLGLTVPVSLAFLDIDGNGIIDTNDFNLVRARSGKSLL